MPRRVMDSEGNIVSMTYTRDEVLGLFRIDEEQLELWGDLIGPEESQYSFSPQELRVVAERVAVLKTGMSTEEVQGIERSGLLHGYAELAQDAPPGISASVWRSYAVIVLYQTEYHRALNAYELAEIAQIKAINPLTNEFEESPDMAKMHLRLLQGTPAEDSEGQRQRLLTLRDGVWEHQGLPRCLQRRQAAKQRKNS